MKKEDCYDILFSMMRTEKGTRMLQDNQYLFVIQKFANKIQVKEAVEKIYSVKVKNVNTINMYGKKRRVRFKEGKRRDWKKAIVTLEKGHTIDVT